MASPTVVYLKTTPKKDAFTHKAEPPANGTQEAVSEPGPQPHLCCILLQSAGSSEKLMITPLAAEDSSKPPEKFMLDICSAPLDTDTFQCHCCPALFKEADSLALHLRLHAGSETLKCEICCKRFMYQEDLKLHLEAHAGLRKLESITFVCTMCPKVLKGTSALSAHVNMHADDSMPKCTVCSIPFREQKSLDRHMLRHPFTEQAKTLTETVDNRPPPKSAEEPEPKETFPCELCLKVFENASSFSGHMRMHSDVGLHKCTLCSVPFRAKKSLARHMLLHSLAAQAKVRTETVNNRPPPKSEEEPEPKPTFPCKLCPRVFKTRSAFSGHMRVHSNVGTHKCTVCSISFRKKKNLDAHMLLHSLTEQAKSETGKRPTVDDRPPPKPEEEPEPKQTFPCKLCPKVFKTASTFSGHMRLHSDVGTRKCPVCSVPFLSKNRLDKHIRKHAQKATICSNPGQESVLEPVQSNRTYEPKPESCMAHTASLPHASTDSQEELILALKQESWMDDMESLSNASTDSQGELTQSPVSHADSEAAPTFMCSTCSKTFPTRHILGLHEAAHAGQQCEKPAAKCVSRSTDQPIKLNGHTCKECNEVFNYSSAYWKHVRRGCVRGYRCTVCSLSFHVKAGLKKHMLSHIGARPYKCKWCGYASKKRDTLKCHENLHTGKTPFKCNVCGDRFGHRSNLWYHMKLHPA